MTTLYKQLIKYRNNKTKNCKARNEALAPLQETQQKIIDNVQLTKDQLNMLQFQPYQADVTGMQSVSTGQQIQAMKQLQASKNPEYIVAEDKEADVWATYFEKKDNTVNCAMNILQNNLGFMGKAVSTALHTYEHYMDSIECAVNPSAAKGYERVHPTQDFASFV